MPPRRYACLMSCAMPSMLSSAVSCAARNCCAKNVLLRDMASFPICVRARSKMRARRMGSRPSVALWNSPAPLHCWLTWQHRWRTAATRWSTASPPKKSERTPPRVVTPSEAKLTTRACREPSELRYSVRRIQCMRHLVAALTVAFLPLQALTQQSMTRGEASLTAEAIMARVAANQDSSEAERSHYIYVQHAHVVSRKGKTVMCEETTDSRVTPSVSG